MKQFFKIAFAALAITSLYACKHIEEGPETVPAIGTRVLFTASQESVSPDTRTVRKEDGSTWWNAAEEISVFCNRGSDGGSKFVSQNTSSQAIAEFSGNIQKDGSDNDYWAVYPYSTDNSCDGSSVTMVIPVVQVASEGNFSGNAFPLVARTNTNELTFLNICGGVKFSLSRNDIKSVTIKGNGGEVLAGKVQVSFDNEGKPVVAEIIDGNEEVTLNAPEEGTFKADTYYYITMLPASLGSGITMSFYTESERGIVVSDKAQVVKRSIFGCIDNADSYADKWQSLKNPEPEIVDLGLSVKWASWNVGASSEEEYGDYYAWGALEPDYENNYFWPSYPLCNGVSHALLKYNVSDDYGQIDNITVLEPKDDIATVSWGGQWRMPTITELEELRNPDNCDWTWTTVNEVPGVIVTSKIQGYTDKSIFLPAAGYKYGNLPNYFGELGIYWSSSLYHKVPAGAYRLIFKNTGTNWSNGGRCGGQTVRAVYGPFIDASSVELSDASWDMATGETHVLSAIIAPANASEKNVWWASEDETVATVDSVGVVTAVAVGSATITARTSNGLVAYCTVNVKDPYSVAPSAVDLGLSVKWAAFNLGAIKPEGFGRGFAWGEIEPKTTYSWATYKWCGGSNTTLTKYNTLESSGTVDGKTTLDPEDDAAQVNLGGYWRMPTEAEFAELMDPNNCTWTWTNVNGVYGYRVTSKKAGYTDKSIFLPAAGSWSGTNHNYANTDGFYWSSSLGEDAPYGAWYIDFHGSNQQMICNNRCYGRSIRPVLDDANQPDLNFNENSYLSWSSNASVQTNGGRDYIRFETYLSGFSASVVEMKFQLTSSEDYSSPIASSGNMASDYGYSHISISDTSLDWREDNNHLSISLSEAGASRTGVITLRFDGPERTITVNGHSFSSDRFADFEYSYLFAEYYRERDEGLYETLTGIPDNSRIYYCKGWDSNGKLVYLGYPTRAVNPASGVEEYCWYTYASGTVSYQFAHESKTYGGFGGYIYQ